MKSSTLVLIAAGVWLYCRYKGPRAAALVTTDPNSPGGHTVRPGMGLTLPPAAPDAVLGNMGMNPSGGFLTATFKYQPSSFGVQRATDSPMFPAPWSANPAQRGAVTRATVNAGTGIDPSTTGRVDMNNP